MSARSIKSLDILIENESLSSCIDEESNTPSDTETIISTETLEEYQESNLIKSQFISELLEGLICCALDQALEANQDEFELFNENEPEV
jgi:hypothetical protein